MSIKNRNIYSVEDPYVYLTNDLPIECFVEYLPTELVNDNVYFCDQKEKGIRCLIKVAYEPFQTFAQSSATKIAKVFGDINNKFLQNHSVLRHKTKDECFTRFKTQYSELCYFDKNSFPEIANTLLLNTTADRTYLPYANLIYCFTDDRADISTFQIYVNKYSNESLKSWINVFDETKHIVDATSEEQRTQMKEEVLLSFLFRNLFTDFDFTTKNLGVIYKKDGTVMLAPNFDYGEFFNPVRKRRYQTLPKIDFDLIPPEMRQFVQIANQNMLESAKRETPEGLAHNPYSDSYNKENIKFICKHYPHLAYQFLNLIRELQKPENVAKINNIIDSYGEKGASIITQDQCNFVKEFIKQRYIYYSAILKDKLKDYIERGYIQSENAYICDGSAYQPN